MEGYELYRLSDEEIQHVGVKGMKWGKRKSRSAYMQKVDAHESKTSARRDAKKAASKAKYEQEKSEFKQVKDKIAVKKLNKARAKDAIENYKKSLVKSLDDPMVKALVASSIYANNSYSMDSTRTGANAHRQMFY